MRAIRGIPAALLATLLSIPSASAAGPDAAQALFDRGIRAMEAGRFDEACPALEESYKQDPRPGLLFTLAECEARRGRFAAAAAHYDAFLVLYASLPPDKKAKQSERAQAARDQRAALAPKIAELTLVLPPNAPAGTTVTRDGTTLAESALGVPFPVEPGQYVVTAKAPDGTVTETRVTLMAGAKRAVALDVRTAATPGNLSPTKAEDSGAVNKTVVAVGAAVGGAAVVVGAVLLGVGANKSGTISTLQAEIKATGGCVDTSSGKCAELISAGNSRSTLGTAGVWMLVGGGVIGVGTLIYGLAGGGSTKTPKRSGLRVLPVVTGDGGGLVVGGAF